MCVKRGEITLKLTALRPGRNLVDGLDGVFDLLAQVFQLLLVRLRIGRVGKIGQRVEPVGGKLQIQFGTSGSRTTERETYILLPLIYCVERIVGIGDLSRGYYYANYQQYNQ